MNFVPYFDEQINIQQRAIFSFKVWLIVQVCAGVLVILCSIILGRWFSALSSDLIKLGGGFVATLAVFPGKEIFPRKETIAKCDCFKRNFQQYEHLSPEEQKLLTAQALQMIGK